MFRQSTMVDSDEDYKLLESSTLSKPSQTDATTTEKPGYCRSLLQSAKMKVRIDVMPKAMILQSFGP
jgi:hypothetical protein